jgi:hypothetical protein
MTDKALDISVEAEAAQLAKKLRKREGFAWALGILIYGFLEVMRLIYWPEAGKWFVVGWLIPFEALVFLIAFVSATSMQSTLRDRGYSNERNQFEKSISLMIGHQDAEGLRLVRGIAVASAICALVLGMVMSGVVRTYFFN